MAVDTGEAVTEVKKLADGIQRLGKPPIPPSRRQPKTQGNRCLKCQNPGYIVRVRKPRQKNYMKQTYCYEHIGRLIVENACTITHKRVGD